MDCLTDEELHEFVRGALPAESSDRHLDDCAECQARLGAFVATVDPSLLGPGLRLGRYRIDHLVATRPASALYAATDAELGRRVLLELYRDPIPDPEERRRRLEEESAAAVSHVSMPRIVDSGALADRLFLARERVHGTLVPQWLALHPRHWREVAGVFRRAGEGLALAHEAGLARVERSAASILIDDAGRVVFRGSLVRAAPEEIAADREAFRASFRESLAGLSPPGWLSRALDPATPAPSLRPLLTRLARKGSGSRAGRAALAALALAAIAVGWRLGAHLVPQAPTQAPTPTPAEPPAPTATLMTAGTDAAPALTTGTASP